MSEGKTNGLTRRSFLKTSAAAAGVAAMAGSLGSLVGCNSISVNNEKATTEDQIFKVVCRPNCMQNCLLDAHVREGKAVYFAPAEVDDYRYGYHRCCLRGLSHAQRIYSKERIKYPMKRVGERGEGAFERITWEEALDTIESEFKRIQQEHGKEAIGFYGLSGQYGLLTMTLRDRFAKVMEMTNVAGWTDLATMIGITRSLGGQFWQQTNEIADYANAKTLIAWSVNPTEAQTQTWRFYADAVENGARLITIDPMFSTVASKSDSWIPLRPGSDPALILSMMQVIISEELYDLDFVTNKTVAPFLVKRADKKFLRESDLVPNGGDTYLVWDAETSSARRVDEVRNPTLEGNFRVGDILVDTAFTLLKEQVEEYTPEKQEAYTEILPDTVRNLARVYATETPSTIVCGFGADKYDNGHLTGHALATLAAITGNLGKKGAGVGAHNRGVPANPSVTDPWASSDEHVKGGTNYLQGNLSMMALPEIIETGKFNGVEYTLKALYITQANPISNVAHQKLWTEKVFPAMEFIVVTDMTFCDTALYADILLPHAHWFEMMDIPGTGNSSYMMLSEQIMEPLYESKPDPEIWRLVCERFDKGEYFDKSQEEFLTDFLDNDDDRSLGLTMDSLKEKHAIRSVPGDLYIEYEGGTFDTPSGRAEFYLETPYTFYELGQDYASVHDYLPEFKPPHEAWPDNQLYDKYPLVYITDHSKFRVHSQWWDIPWLQDLEGEPFVRINPLDAQKRGIEQGDYVRVFNDRGEAVVKAALTEGARPGVVSLPRCGQIKQYVSGFYQEMTQTYINPITLNQSFFDVLVDVEKA
jgi:molybdopterin-containing oxidoreductase family molybdopterin binding subunit